MRASLLGMCAVGVVALGCSSTQDPAPGPTSDEKRVAGFAPTAPAEGEIQVITPIIKDIPAGSDVTYCSYLDFVAAKTMDVTSYLGFQSKEGHHSILYAVPKNPQKPNSHECTDADMFNVKYIGGGGTDATISASKIPPGIAFRVPEGAQLMIVSHWINSSDQAVDGQAAYNIAVQDPEPSMAPGDLFTVVTTNFTLPVGKGSAHMDCQLKDDLQFFLIGGHAHEWATHVTITRTPADAKVSEMIYDTPWKKELVFDTPLNSYTKDKPLVMKKGDTFSVDCLYDNTTKDEIKFPTEMCVGFGYFFPATAEIDCVDGSWPGN